MKGFGIDARIERIREYFVQFNAVAEESAFYLIIKVPSTWSIPDANALKENFGAECQKVDNKGGIIIGVDFSESTDVLFDAAEYIISFNKDVEERVRLLNACINQLKGIFGTKSLEELKAFAAQLFKNENEEIEEKVVEEPIEEVKEKPKKQAKGKSKSKKEPTAKAEPQKVEETDPLLSFVEANI